MKKLKSMYSKLTKNEARAFWACVVMTVLSLITFVFSTIPSFSNEPTLGNLIGKIIPPLIGLSALSSGLLILRQRFNMAGAIFILGFGITIVVTPMIVQGLGFITAGMVFIGCSYFASLILKGRAVDVAQYASAAMAVAILLLEVYWPSQRPDINARDLRITVIAAIAVIAMYSIFLFQMFPSFKLRSKLTIISLMLAILPMAIIGAMAVRVSESALTRDANESLTSSAVQIAASLDTFILSNLDSLRTEAKLKQVVEYLEMDTADRNGSPEEAELGSMLASFQQKSPLMISSYALQDRFGIVVADTVSEELYMDKSESLYFKEPMRTGLPFVSPVMYYGLESKPYIYFSAPVRNAIGDIIGVLRVRYNADIFQQQMIRQSGSTGRTGNFYLLIGQNNTMIGHTSRPDLMYKSIVSLAPEKYREMQSSGFMPADQPLNRMAVDLTDLSRGIAEAASGTAAFTGEFHEVEEGVTVHGERAVAAVMKTAPWYVVAAQEEARLYGPITNMVRGVVVMGIVAGVLSVGLAVLVAQILTAPLGRLTRVAEKVAQGDLSARAAVTQDDEVGVLANTFNTMAAQLTSLIGSLEQRVADRTKALVTSTEVSRRLSTILDRESLVKEVVEQLHQAFHYYHVHIYLLDDAGQNLVMAGGTGEAGKIMLSRGHQIAKGKGLVGQAAEIGVPVLVPDVTKAEGWLPNPLLPDTKAELAVPITLGEIVIGVLDVQQNMVDGLQQYDADLLQSIASQVAVALQNARSYHETQRRANREALAAAISQRIQRTATAEEALQVAVRELGRALDAPQATVRLSMKPGSGNGNGHNHS